MFRLFSGTLAQRLPQFANRMVATRIPALSTQFTQTLATKAVRPNELEIKRHNEFLRNKIAMIRKLDLYVNAINVLRPLEARELIQNAEFTSKRFMLTKCQSEESFKQCLKQTNLKALLSVPVEKIPRVKKINPPQKMPSAAETARLSRQFVSRSIWRLNPEQQQFESNKQNWLRMINQYIQTLQSTHSESAVVLAEMRIHEIRAQFEECATKAELVAAITRNKELFYNNEWGFGVLSAKTVTESSIKEGLDIWFMKRLQGAFPADIVMGPESVQPRKP